MEVGATRPPARNGTHPVKTHCGFYRHVDNGQYTMTVEPPDVLHPETWGPPIHVTLRL